MTKVKRIIENRVNEVKYDSRFDFDEGTELFTNSKKSNSHVSFNKTTVDKAVHNKEEGNVE